jgi:hypothetical protein
MKGDHYGVTFRTQGERIRTVILSPFFMPMTDQVSKNTDSSSQNRLYPEDQAKVDAFVSTGVNSIKRKPFRPGRLVVILIVIVVGLSAFSQFLARWAGVY